MKTIYIFAILLGLILLVLVTSCAPATKVSFPTITPIVTATPIALGVNIRDIYREPPECKSYDALNEAQDILAFINVTGQVNFDRLMVEEIADSARNKYRAYLVTDLSLIPSNCEAGCSSQRIYVKDIARGEIFEINWSGYLPRRITYKLVWIGDNILAFQQGINPYNGETIAVDIAQKRIVFRLTRVVQLDARVTPA